MAKTSQAILEHYGFELSSTAVAKITREIASEAKTFNAESKTGDGRAPLLVAQIDGSMVPVVEYGKPSEEQRNKGRKHNRHCHWREFRLCTVSDPRDTSTYYGVVQGSPLEAGCMMYQCCRKKGMGGNTRIHGVADGAPWIAEQYEVQFGANHEFYIDYYHVTEYLGAASAELDTEMLEGSTREQWLTGAKDKLKQGKAPEVIAELARHAVVSPEASPLRTAHQYLTNRSTYLNYAKPLAENLPIGSGEVESAHRSVLQARLKKPGAWWKLENAENMAHLKVMQSNNQWHKFWQKNAA